ncbi:hypothetical protein [Paracidobacterium acidisoli]|uniref:Uncharacterized protein n=1 Tax=Paracidobacterium acidisoli TaxID=2303751 RepID=A0A372IP78_9BACT|nr:hypothetical protein [Paracidobacterium acidisoli]MBT9331051.1 hypothetical protein [Paracidobacterium acidisoli]
MMLRVLLFAGFLVAYIVWVLACLRASNKLQSDAVKGHTFWASELLLLLNYGAFFGFIWILSGLWSLRLVVMFLLASQLGTLVSLGMAALLGAETPKSAMRAMWMAVELQMQQPMLFKVMTWLTGIVFWCYPIVAGVIYFRHPLYSGVVKILMVKYSLLLLILGGYPLMLVVLIGLLASENLDEETRQGIFINQLGGMIPTALFVALALWAFGAGGVNHSFDMAALSGTLSLRTLLLLLLFFACVVLLPYLIGSKRARRRRLDFLQEQSGFIAGLVDVLESPTPLTWQEKLTKLRGELADRRTKLVDDEVSLQMKAELDAGSEVPPQLTLAAEALKNTSGVDARFLFSGSLNKLEEEVSEIAADLQSRPPAGVEAAAALWSKKYETRKADLAKEMESATTKKTLVTVGMGAAATTIVSAILSEVGKAAWTVISQHAVR